MVRINCTERYRGAAGSRLLRRELERVHASAHRTDVYEGAMLATGDSQSRLATRSRKPGACFCPVEMNRALVPAAEH